MRASTTFLVIGIFLVVSPARGQLKDFLTKSKDTATLVGDVAKGLADKASDLVPSVDDVLDFSKQTFAGLPFQAALSAFNKVCE